MSFKKGDFVIWVSPDKLSYDVGTVEEQHYRNGEVYSLTVFFDHKGKSIVRPEFLTHFSEEMFTLIAQNVRYRKLVKEGVTLFKEFIDLLNRVEENSDISIIKHKEGINVD